MLGPSAPATPVPRRSRPWALVVVAVLGLGGLSPLACSSGVDGDPGPGSPATTNAASVRARTPEPPVATATAAPPAAVAALTDLLARRLELGVEIARTKWNTKAPIEDLAREAQTLEAIGAAAVAAGADPAAAKRLLQAQIDAGKVVQRSLHEQWTAQGQPPFAEVADLVTDLRPELDEINTLLVARLRELGTLPVLDAPTHAVTERDLTTRLAGVPRAAEAARTALAPLRAG